MTYYERQARRMMDAVESVGSSVAHHVMDPAALRRAIRSESRRRGITGTRTIIPEQAPQTVCIVNEELGRRHLERDREVVDEHLRSVMSRMIQQRPEAEEKEPPDADVLPFRRPS